MISILLFACAPKVIDIIAVDIAEENVCILQLSDETFVEIESNLCSNLKEGDILRVVRKR